MTNADSDERSDRVAESVRRALQLVGHAEGGVERDSTEEPASAS
jgi:hypothetical protein